MSDMRHSIKLVARKTGLSPHVIRVWERRYGAVKPARTGTNRRLYADEDVERLGLLQRAVKAGHNIGSIATLPMEQLGKLVDDAAATPSPSSLSTTTPEGFVEESLEAVRELNARRLEDALTRGIVTFGVHGLLEKVVGPLAWRIGEMWRDGSLTAAHEHFASAVIRTFLGRNSNPFLGSTAAPVLVVGTPSGQLHELGAVMVAAAANDVGWRVIYLGPSLPAAEIAGIAVQNRARAVALSIVYPEDDPNLSTELENLRRYLPAEIKIVVGGRAAEAYSDALKKIGAIRTRELKEVYSQLDAFRQR
ncbi:MAG TPA: MerR family transcriptional regulator [Clostridia bacterium]|nr:MerR family transcriptional regulator [Clostridia bacterium]